MRIIGAHSILYSRRPEADRAFLRDVIGFPSVDAGDGWLIFGLPPAELAVHPSEENDVHEFDDVGAFVAQMEARVVRCDPVQSMGWGLLTQVTLPGGGRLGVYQPRHARPKTMGARKTSRKPGRRRSKAGKNATRRTSKTSRRRA